MNMRLFRIRIYSCILALFMISFLFAFEHPDLNLSYQNNVNTVGTTYSRISVMNFPVQISTAEMLGLQTGAAIKENPEQTNIQQQYKNQAENIDEQDNWEKRLECKTIYYSQEIQAKDSGGLIIVFYIESLDGKKRI